MRHYDPTIGRWLSTDPYDEFASPYLGMGNDPVNNDDPDRGCVGGWLGSVHPQVSVGSLSNHATPAVGQFSGILQGPSLPAGSSGASSGSGGGGGSGGGALNAAGNAIAGYLGQMVADKLFLFQMGQMQGNCNLLMVKAGLPPIQQAEVSNLLLRRSQCHKVVGVTARRTMVQYLNILVIRHNSLIQMLLL